MNLGFSEEEKMLQESARDFLVKECPKTLVRQMEEDEKGYSPELWQKMADLGWLGISLPDKYDGQDMGFVALTILFEEMGRACLPGPFLSTVVLGALPILEFGNEEQKKEFLPRIAQGKLLVTLALNEVNAGYSPDAINIKAEPTGDDFIINGTKLFVPDAHIADYFLCVARSKVQGDAKKGITVFIIDAKTAGIKVSPLQTIASDRQCEVSLDKVRVPRENVLGELHRGWAVVEKTLQKAAVVKCAELVGGAQQVLEMSVAYAKERVQFGRLIGSFQAIQHHCANMAVDVESSRHITYYAAWLLNSRIPCAKEVAMAKAWVSEACYRITLLGHQIHGGVGFTKDHDLQLYFRRSKAGELLFGDGDFHRELIASELGL